MGVLLCLISAAAFGAMAIFGKLAYDAGVAVLTLLALRFGITALALGGASALTGRVRHAMDRPTFVRAFGLGAVGYAAQAGLFFAALERMDASVLSLLLYTYPAMVVVAALVLGREHADPRRFVALTAATAGVALVLVGAGAGSFDLVGALMGLGAAATYTTYILVADATVGGVHPVPLTAVITAGATTTFLLVGVPTGAIDLGFEPIGWLWLAGIVVVSTVVSNLCFLAGLRRVGPSTASILSTVEPPVTVALAYLVFSETLTPVQLAGGALVLAAVVLLQLRRRESVPAPVPATA